MIQVSAKTNVKKAKKFLNDVQRKDIPFAKIKATQYGARAVVTQVKRNIAKGAHVPQKYITGRITGGKYNRKTEGVKTRLWHMNLNPAGTRKHPNAIKSAYRITKTGKKGKGHGQLQAMGRKYDNAFTFSKGWKIPIILQRTGPNAYPIERKVISIDGWAQSTNRNTSGRLFPPKFEKEFNRLLKLKVKKRAR